MSRLELIMQGAWRRSSGVGLLLMCAAMLPVATAHAQKMAIAWKADSARRDTTVKQISEELRRLGIVKWSIPEYHDEQRFPDWGNAASPSRSTVSPPGKFGPVVNIYASPYLDDFDAKKPWQFYEHGTRGVMVAVVFVDTAKGSVLPAVYQKLHLAAGMNCIWLAHPNAQLWTASISLPLNGQCDRHNAPGGYFTLGVSRSVINGAPSAAYAPVTRFGESDQGTPSFGVKCLDGWCEIGLPNESWNIATAAPTSIPVRRIRGWFDEQWISLGDANGVLKPFMYASVFPAMNVASHPVSAYSFPVAVAVIVLPANPPSTSHYYRWGLRRGENVVYLRNRPQGWEVRIGSGANVLWLPAHRMPHRDAGVPGTARWRYISLDDGIWVPCGQACCRVDDS